MASAHSSQIVTPFFCSVRTLVSPARNQSSSWIIRFQEQLFGCHHREAVGQIEAHLMAENGKRAGACAVALLHAVLQNFFHKVVILTHTLTHRFSRILSRKSGLQKFTIEAYITRAGLSGLWR